MPQVEKAYTVTVKRIRTFPVVERDMGYKQVYNQ